MTNIEDMDTHCMKKLNIVSSSMLFFCISAQATEINIYGQGHLSADNLDDSLYVTSSSSRLGFNGSYVIDTDLKVIFQYESGVDLTGQGGNDGNGGAESSGQIFTKGRPSFIGLEGKYGKALIGHMPFLDQWANDYNLFADQVGDLGNLWEASGVPGRSDNVMYYKTPRFSNIDIAVTYVPEEGKDNSDLLLFKANYNLEHLKVGMAYTSVGQGINADNDHTAAAVTVGYTHGRYTIGGGFQLENDIAGLTDNDRETFNVGASLKVGKNGKIKAQFASSTSDQSESDASQFAVGYDYNLAKNTVIYVAYALMDNEDNVRFSVNGKGHGDKVVPAYGVDPSVFSIGIVYQFNHGLLK